MHIWDYDKERESRVRRVRFVGGQRPGAAEVEVGRDTPS